MIAIPGPDWSGGPRAPTTRIKEARLPRAGPAEYALSPVQLPLGPFMPVQTKLHAPRCVAAHLYKQRAEVLVVNVEVIVVHVDRFVPRELELPVDLLSAEGLRLLLGYAHENDLVPHLALAADLVTLRYRDRESLKYFGHLLDGQSHLAI